MKNFKKKLNNKKHRELENFLDFVNPEPLKVTHLPISQTETEKKT